MGADDARIVTSSALRDGEPPSRFRTDIQGLRAVAVGAVVLYHAGVPFVPGGYVGVDVFFVISGFLITSHLLSAIRRDGRIKFASFYARRARRILPASFAVLGLSVVAALIWMPPLLMREVWAGAVATALYVPNLLFAFEGTNYLAESTPSLVQHYWSLGIEEQFYLFWPILLALGFFVLRKPRALFIMVIALFVLSFAACVCLTFWDQPWAFFSLPTRAWELSAGGIAAFLLTYRSSVLGGARAALVGWLGISAILAAALAFSGETQFPGYWAALPVAGTAAVIIAGATAPRFGPSSVLSSRGMMFVGAISYSLYLVHWPLLIIPQAAIGFENPLPLWGTLLLGVVAVPLAWMLYRYVENPGRDASWLTRARPRRTLFVAAGASIASVVLATGAFAFSSSIPLYSDRASVETAIIDPPVETTFVPNNLQPSLRDVSDDQPEVYADGCHLGFDEIELQECVYGDASAPRIVLFGDSHASQWFPAVLTYAESIGYSVQIEAKSSCPSISADLLVNNIPYTACSVWRDAVIREIRRLQPALVVIANYGDVNFADQDGGYAEAWSHALSRTLDAIHVETVVLADTPDLGHTPSVCLSANLNDARQCGQTRRVALSAPTRTVEMATSEEHGATFVDLTDYICGPDRCSPIIGNTLAYRDGHHLTATFSAELGAAFGTEMRRLLPEFTRG